MDFSVLPRFIHRHAFFPVENWASLWKTHAKAGENVAVFHRMNLGLCDRISIQLFRAEMTLTDSGLQCRSRRIWAEKLRGTHRIAD